MHYYFPGSFRPNERVYSAAPLERRACPRINSGLEFRQGQPGLSLIRGRRISPERECKKANAKLPLQFKAEGKRVAHISQRDPLTGIFILHRYVCLLHRNVSLRFPTKTLNAMRLKSGFFCYNRNCPIN